MTRAETGQGEQPERTSKEVSRLHDISPKVLEGTVHVPRRIQSAARRQVGVQREETTEKEGSERAKALTSQLDTFLARTAERAGPYEVTRTWLQGEDLSVYVRRNQKPFGSPQHGAVIILGEESKVVLPNVHCLEIAQVEFKQDTIARVAGGNYSHVRTPDMASWESFIVEAATVAQRNGLELMVTEDVTDPRLLQWFQDQVAQASEEDLYAWQTPDYVEYNADPRRHFFFRWLPPLDN